MNTPVTQEQIEVYQRDGCIILKDFLTAVEVEELIDAVEENVAQMGRQKVPVAARNTIGV